MSPSIKQKTAIPVFLVALVLACFAISRSAQAAEPSGIQSVSQFNPPFRQRITISMDHGTNFAARQFALPAGKTLVVEFVSAEASLPAGEQPIELQIASLEPKFLRKTSSHTSSGTL
jgi:ABC-type sugar transport system substrate-binding protein